MEQRVTMISLGVDDVAASTAFYKRLGWVPSVGMSNESITFFQIGGIFMGLYGRTALAEEANLTVGTGFGGMAIAYNGRSKDEVDAVLALAEKSGAKILNPAKEMFWGGYSGYFADPDGHVWEVAFNPFLPIAEDGTIKLPDQQNFPRKIHPNILIYIGFIYQIYIWLGFVE